MKKYFQTLLLLAFCWLGSLPASAQCGTSNTAFQEGEQLQFHLYFNWKFIWFRVGDAQWDVKKVTLNGRPAYRTSLTTAGTKRADRYFVMRDTLTAYNRLDLTPIYYQKDGIEGKQHRHEKVWYSYQGNQCHLKMYYQRDDKPEHFKTEDSKFCAFDMISMLLRARSYDAKQLKKGERQRFLMAEGRKAAWKDIEFVGRETIQVHKSKDRYRCLVFSYLEEEKGKEKEIVRFYITDDDNHLPVRLDMNLSFGSAKAYLVNYKGLRHPLTAKVK